LAEKFEKAGGGVSGSGYFASLRMTAREDVATQLQPVAAMWTGMKKKKRGEPLFFFFQDCAENNFS
jgi:hypothetical protein